jgi:hypothetical protein
MGQSAVHRKSVDVLYMWSYLTPIKQQWYCCGRSGVRSAGVKILHITCSATA